MKNLTVDHIAEACGGKVVLSGGFVPGNIEAAQVTTDSREAGKDTVFIALKGTRVDGHRFIPGVLEKGALACVCELLPEGFGETANSMPGACILVEDCFAALRDIAELYRCQVDAKVIGVTGSMGKTTTKEFIAAVLGTHMKVHKTQANYNNEIGLPATVFAMPEDTEAAVLEMGINHFGEMHRLSKVAKPDICVFSNIGDCHLEFLGDRPGVLRAKSEIFDFMAEDGTVIINGDDEQLITLKEVKGKTPITCGFGEHNMYRALEIENLGIEGCRARIRNPKGEIFTVTVPLPGEHMVRNALTGAAVGELFGLSKEEIARGILEVKSLQGRGHVIRTEEYVILDDCYNANPASMMAGIDTLANTPGRKVAILGDMFELGENEKELHRKVGRHVIEKGVDLLITTGELSGQMCEAAEEEKEKQKANTRILHFDTREELEAALPGLLQEQDAILVKASHGMGYASIVKLLARDAE